MRYLNICYCLITLVIGITSVYASSTESVNLLIDEVTQPDIAISPDGETLYFNALGHIVRMPAEGGEAEQLTYGPHFDSNPAISPDGRYLAFVSDRDELTNGSLYIMDLETGEIKQITEGIWVSRPAWSPDGSKISYLKYRSIGLWSQYEFVAPIGIETEVRQVALDSKKDIAISPGFDFIRSVFYFPSGALGWSVVEPESKEAPAMSKIYQKLGLGKPELLMTLPGTVDRVSAHAKTNGLVVRSYPRASSGVLIPQDEKISLVDLATGNQKEVTKLLSPQPRPRFALSENSLFLGEAGKIYQVSLATGDRKVIRFNADIKSEFYPQTPPIEFRPTSVPAMGSTSVLDPRVSADNESIYFTVDGFVWMQGRTDSVVEKLLQQKGFQWGPAALSPDGAKIAYQHSHANSQELRVKNLQTGSDRLLISIDRSGRFEPSWSPDSKRIAYVRFEGIVPTINIIDLDTGNSRKIVDGTARWMPRPSFSADGKSIYFTAQNRVFQQSIDETTAKPVAIATISDGQMADGTISSDGAWLAYRRNAEIHLISLKSKSEAPKKLSTEGGWNFSFTPDSKSIVYAIGNKVWEHSIAGGQRREIPLRLIPGIAKNETLLINNLRILNLEKGVFSDETSLFIQDGIIAAVGSDAANKDAAKILDANGRYAIPGMFDMHVHMGTPIHFVPARDVSRNSAFIDFGVTSVRDMGSDITLLNAWRDRRNSHATPVPRIFSGGAMIESPGRLFFHGGSIFAHSEEDARAIVRKAKRDGAIAIKSYFTLTWPLHRAVADEARIQGMPVASHGLLFREMLVGTVLGRSTIEHQVTPTRVYSDIFKLMAASGVRWDPTIGAVGGNPVLYSQNKQLLRQPRLLATTSKSDRSLSADVFSDLKPEAIINSYKGTLASIKQARDLGVTVLAGTDALNPGVFYGHSLHLELMHQARSGVAEIDLIRMVTIDSAKTLGAERHLGSIEEGKLADIVLLDENPLDDISNTQSIWRVLFGGHIFQR